MRWGGQNPHRPIRNMKTAITFDEIVRFQYIWYAWIHNEDLQVISIYMFLIKPSMASEMAHFHKNMGVCSSIPNILKSNNLIKCYSSLHISLWPVGILTAPPHFFIRLLSPLTKFGLWTNTFKMTPRT